MDIGSKIKDARIAAGLTQEQAAEALCVSRQTISNWENRRTYPDIVSVVKMSDLYGVSLDHLLKGQPDTPTSPYVDFLARSTDTVSSRNRLSLTILLTVYLGIWAFALIVFWFFTSGSDAMGYSLMFLWLLLPVTIFVISLFIGQNDAAGSRKWFLPAALGLSYMLAEYATFSMANMIAFQKVNLPRWGMILAGALISAAGLAAGTLSKRRRAKNA